MTTTSDVFKHSEAFDPTSHHLNVIVDTPGGSRNKYKYDEQYRLFRLQHILPIGMFFPYDFGYIPSTLGEDGDPLDVLLLIDEPAFVGCLVPARLLGVLEAEQKVQDKFERNDRLIAVAIASHAYTHIQSLEQLGEPTLTEIEHFFVSYNTLRNRVFKPQGWADAARAHQLIGEGIAHLRHHDQ